MMRRISTLLAIPFYPFLIGAYTVVFLWSVNIGQIIPAVVLRALGVSFGLGLVVFLACLALLRSLPKAGLLSAWLLIVMFTYGHFYGLLDGVSVAGFMIGRYRFLLPLVGLLTLAVAILVMRTRADLRPASRLLNLVMLLMLGMAAAPIIGYEIRYGSRLYLEKKNTAAAAVVPPVNAPDVYYIVLDGYARADVLANDFQFDNQEFIDGLEEMGFYLPECAYSNYITTTPSLSSTMNMEYLENMGISEKATTFPFDPSLAPLMIRSRVRQEFEGMGYKIAAFHGYMPALDLRDADYYFNYEVQERQANRNAIYKFERMYLRTTLLRPLVEAYEANAHGLDFLPDFLLDILYTKTDYGPYILTDMQWRHESEYSFSVLPGMPRLAGKKFVYAHFYTTHKPYVFDQAGGYLPQSLHKDDWEGYIHTVRYTNKRMLPILRGLIQDSVVKPIIILQADHGPGVLTGVPNNKILHALYFPDQDYSRLYSTITPTNIFRVVLSQFFAKDYPLLADTLLVKDVFSDGTFSLRHLPAACDLK